MRNKSLGGLKVLITRPCPSGDAISRAIEEHGGTAIKFPVIEISTPDSFVALDALLHGIGDIDLLVFVSAAAIEGFVARKKQQNILLPEGLKIAAMGPETARHGRDEGLNIDFIPRQSADSEGLLVSLKDSESGINLKESRVTILRGQSGRDLLKVELEKLGAEVTFVQCYTRRTTSRSIQPIMDRWSAGEIDVVMITSVSILDGLLKLLGPQNSALLTDSPVITISERIKYQCISRGITCVRVARGVSNHCLIDAMLEFAQDDNHSALR